MLVCERNPHLEVFAQFNKKICNSVTNAAKIAKINFEYKLVNDMSDNPKAFWKYVRLTQKTKDHVADLRTCKGVLMQ